MPIFTKRIVEEELERIKKANLPPEKPEAEETIERETTEEPETTEAIQTDEVKITPKDIIAMIIAAFSIIIPYALIFLGLTALIVYFFFR